MKTKTNQESEHILKKIWDNCEAINTEVKIKETPVMERFFADFFSLGPYYYYVIDSTGLLSDHHENVLKMHGLKFFPLHVNEIIQLIHPDDIPFVVAAEKMCYDKVSEIGKEHIMNLKSSYCFRMRTAKNNYELFHHQAIHSKISDDGRLIQTINIHTNINHFAQKNEYIALVSGVGSRDDFHQMQYHKNEQITYPQTCLTKREIEILTLISQGYKSKQIAERLSISEHTVRTHRKNIFEKSNCSNSTQLVKKAFEQGFI